MSTKMSPGTDRSLTHACTIDYFQARDLGVTQTSQPESIETTAHPVHSRKRFGSHEIRQTLTSYTFGSLTKEVHQRNYANGRLNRLNLLSSPHNSSFCTSLPLRVISIGWHRELITKNNFDISSIPIYSDLVPHVKWCRMGIIIALTPGRR